MLGWGQEERQEQTRGSRKAGGLPSRVLMIIRFSLETRQQWGPTLSRVIPTAGLDLPGERGPQEFISWGVGWQVRRRGHKPSLRAHCYTHMSWGRQGPQPGNWLEAQGHVYPAPAHLEQLGAQQGWEPLLGRARASPPMPGL